MAIRSVCLAGVVAVVGVYGMVSLSARLLDERRAHRAAWLDGPGAAIEVAKPAGADAGQAATRRDPPRDLDQLRARISAILARAHIPGAAIAVVEGDQVTWAGGIGLADRERGVAVTDATLFRVGSVTKSFLVLALMRLVEQGRLDLDAPVAQLVPEIAIGNRWAAEQPITVAQLLEHTAGFDEMRPNEALAPADAEAEAEAMSLYEVLARNPASRVARWRPGSRAAYSNPGYTVAAYLLEKLTGLPYEEVIQRELFQPLGMRDATLRMTASAAARLARGYERDRQVRYRGIYHRPAGNLMISVRDLAVLVQLALGRGRFGDTVVISPASMARIERSETAPMGGIDAGYGLANWGDVSPRVVMRGHGGYMPGFLTLYGYSVSRGFGYVLLLNAAHSNDARVAIRHEIVDYLLRDQVVPPPPRAEVPEPELQRWAGVYHFAAPQIQLMAFRARLSPGIEVFVDRGRLYSRSLPGGDPAVELIPMGGDRFRWPSTSGSSIAFGRDRDGARIFIGRGSYLVEEARWRTLAFAHGAVICIAILGSGVVLPLTRLRRRAGPAPGVGWPLSVALSLLAAPHLFDHAVERGVVGECNAFTVALFVLSLVFAVGSLACAVQALTWLARPGSILGKLHRLVFAAAACCATVFLAAYGIIGIRTWSY